MKTPALFTGMFLATLLGPCANAGVAGIDGPWSILVAGAVPSQGAEGHYVSLLVSSLDGETPAKYEAFTKPGKKMVLLDTPKTASNYRGPSHRRLELDMAPCTRYYVAGKKSGPSSVRWTPEVFRTEPIGECVAEFKLNDVAETAASSPIPVKK